MYLTVINVPHGHKTNEASKQAKHEERETEKGDPLVVSPAMAEEEVGAAAAAEEEGAGQSASLSTTHRRRSRQQRHHVLLGVSGSVAAVKGPEIVCRLVQAIPNAHVKVLLTRGGRHFWDRASEYDPRAWRQLQEYMATAEGTADSAAARAKHDHSDYDDNDNDDNDDDDNDNNSNDSAHRIEIHCM
jgi:Flavoprotein